MKHCIDIIIAIKVAIKARLGKLRDNYIGMSASIKPYLFANCPAIASFVARHDPFYLTAGFLQGSLEVLLHFFQGFL